MRVRRIILERESGAAWTRAYLPVGGMA
jgi:hypothetical protein